MKREDVGDVQGAVRRFFRLFAGGLIEARDRAAPLCEEGGFSASLQAASLKRLEPDERGELRARFSASLQAASLKPRAVRGDALPAGQGRFSASLQAASLKLCRAEAEQPRPTRFSASLQAASLKRGVRARQAGRRRGFFRLFAGGLIEASTGGRTGRRFWRGFFRLFAGGLIEARASRISAADCSGVFPPLCRRPH